MPSFLLAMWQTHLDLFWIGSSIASELTKHPKRRQQLNSSSQPE